MPARRELFERLTTETLALDPGITRHFLKLYVAFKAETNFMDVVPQKARLRLSLNIPLEVLRDERELLANRTRVSTARVQVPAVRVRLIVGVLLCLVGVVWFLQGIDVLGGSG